ncbi:MAG: signal recognition particle-docking protein FtsY [Methylophilus sp.]|nr:signal recognition particle-docking protein FtsY [Methylophilus sp.]
MFDFFKKNKSPETATAPVAESSVDPKKSWTERLKEGLSKTRQQLGGQLASLFGGGKIDDETYEELETILLTSDIGVSATQKLLDNLKKRVKREQLEDTSALKSALKSELLDILSPLQIPLNTQSHSPFIIMLAGVNGAGKTTTIGKLAKRFQAEGNSVLIAAGDTFRAAAREQLQVWGERNNVHVVASEGGDPAAVIFDAVNSAIAKKIDIVIADTAGRLPTQMHLMDEIKKVQRVINKAYASAPHEILLVIDANTGQNAVSQVKAFDDALGVTGLVLSKLDGSAKGGVIAAIAEARPIPIRYIGIGESIDDLRPFSAQEFVDALFDE